MGEVFRPVAVIDNTILDMSQCIKNTNVRRIPIKILLEICDCRIWGVEWHR